MVVHKAKVVWLFASGVVVQISQRGVVVHRAKVVWLFTELMWCGCSQVSGVDTYRAKTFLTELRCSQSYSGVGVHRVTELQWCGCSQS